MFARFVFIAYQQAQAYSDFLSSKAHEAFSLHVGIPEGYGGGSGGRDGEQEGRERESECDFKPIQMSLSLNDSIFRLLISLLKASCNNIRKAIVERTSDFILFNIMPSKGALRGSLWRDTQLLSWVVSHQIALVFRNSIARPSYKDSS